MNTKLSVLATALASFLLGALVSYLVFFKQQMDMVFKPSVFSAGTISSNNDFEQTAQDKDGEKADCVNFEDAKSLDKTIANAVATDTLSINDYSVEQVKKIIDKMPNYVLEQYIDKFMAADTDNYIVDKRRFAERAIEEVYNKNDNSLLTGTAKVSFKHIMPKSSADTSKVTKFAKIYAHLAIDGQSLPNQYVFIKWVNNQTGQVLLFDKKEIFQGSHENWVSYIPDDGWQVGDYDIRFYNFESELTPIAQTSYSIYEVVDAE